MIVSIIKDIFVTTVLRAFLAMVAVLVLIKPVLADDFGVNVMFGGWSYHVNKDDSITNENHNMLAIEFVNQKTDMSAFVGRFDNSFGDSSFMFGVGHRWDFNNWRLGLRGGLVYGYTSCSGLKKEAKPKDEDTTTEWSVENVDESDNTRFCPMLVPSVTYTRLKIQPTVLVMGTAVVFAFNYEF